MSILKNSAYKESNLRWLEFRVVGFPREGKRKILSEVKPEWNMVAANPSRSNKEDTRGKKEISQAILL